MMSSPILSAGLILGFWYLVYQSFEVIYGGRVADYPVSIVSWSIIEAVRRSRYGLAVCVT